VSKMASKAPRIILPKAEPGWASASSSPTLDSIPPGSDSPAKRRCISSACMPCRKRKSKVSHASTVRLNCTGDVCTRDDLGTRDLVMTRLQHLGYGRFPQNGLTHCHSVTESNQHAMLAKVCTRQSAIMILMPITGERAH